MILAGCGQTCSLYITKTSITSDCIALPYEHARLKIGIRESTAATSPEIRCLLPKTVVTVNDTEHTGHSIASVDRLSADDISWTLLDLDELADAYHEIVAPAIQADGLDPETERPTHRWLQEYNFRTLLYTLREHHGRTFTEFWTEDLGLEESADDYDWGIDHKQTVTALEDFLDSRRSRGELSDSSIDTLRYRLAKYVRAYRSANGTEDLLTPVARDGKIPAYEAVDACWAAFDVLHTELDGGRTKRRIHRVVDNWYAHLVRRKRAGINPAAGLNDEYRWEVSNSDNPRLATEHIQKLYTATDDDRERLLVLALCAWGLRSGEVAALHRSNFVLNNSIAEVAYIDFETRKNGPGEVSLLYGREVLENRLAALAGKKNWNGYLFPSARSATGHISRQTVLNWFDQLAERATLPTEIDGEKPVPQMGRRYWYDAYSSALDIVLEGVDEIASEQGSSSPEVVLQNYLSDERNRKLRRESMRKTLADAFSATNASLES